ncbi:MAG: serine/threonine-protein kinase [Nannocystaceae bacterium]|nr:serine/threonine-protein kinase [Nannocystaceae bacterium]
MAHDAAEEVPTRLGRFAVLRRLGAGGMGVVYLAHDHTLDRRLAIKLLATRRYGERERARARLVGREAQAMARLSHPNVVQVYEVGEHDGDVFVAMELIDGLNLRAWDRTLVDELSPRQRLQARLRVLVDAGRGLAAAHAAGIVHRDFKPENVLVGRDGRARVADFGLAGPPEVGTAIDPAGQETGGFDSPLTPGGEVLGTPGYMAPEQFLGGTIDARADQFAFCVSAWEILYGQRPFQGRTRAAILHAVVGGEVTPPPRDAIVPMAIRAALLRGLSTEASARHDSLAPVLAALGLDRARIVRRRALAGGALAVLAGAAWFSYGVGRSGLEPCRGFDAALASTWGEPQREALTQAFVATGSPIARSAVGEAIARLDSHGSALVHTREQVCAATHVRREQSEPWLEQAYACLDRDQRRFAALLEVLSRPDAATVAHLETALASLDDPARCGASALVPAAADPAPVAEVASLQSRLAHAAALADTGAIESARVEAVTIVLDAHAVGSAASAAEAMVLRGRLERALGWLATSRITLERAVGLADLAQHDATRLDALIALADVYGDGLRDAADEARVLEQAQAVARRIDAGTRQRAALDALTADHALRVGDLAGARAAVASLESRGPDHQDDAIVRAAHLALREGSAARAARLFDQATAQARARHGDVHPATAAAQYNAGAAHVDAGDFAGAQQRLQAALATWQAIYRDVPSEDLGRAHVALLACGLATGDLEGAARHARAALTAYDASVGPGHAGRAEALVGLGVVAFTQGDFETAEIVNGEAVEILRQAWGDEHPETAIARSNYGETLLARAHLDDAEVELSAALHVLERTAGAESPDLAFPLKGLGIIRLAQQRADEAVPLLERAAALTGDGQPLERLDIDAALAVAILRATGDLDRARTVAARARVDTQPGQADDVDETLTAALARRRSLIDMLPGLRESFVQLDLAPRR